MQIFISYSHEDVWAREALINHAGSLVHSGQAQFLYDHQIQAGQKWRKQLERKLARADLVVFLVSGNFISSENCMNDEMDVALQAGKPIVPILISDCNYQALPLGEFQFLPLDENERPLAIDRWEPEAQRQSAWTQVAQSLCQICSESDRKKPSNIMRTKSFTKLPFTLWVTIFILLTIVFFSQKYIRIVKIAPEYGLSLLMKNVSNGALDTEFTSCSSMIKASEVNCVKLTGNLHGDGFAMMNLWKPSVILDFWDANLPINQDLYIALSSHISPESYDARVEFTVKDTDDHERHFACNVPVGGAIYHMKILSSDLEAARIDLNRLELIAIGTSSAAGALPGDFEISIFSISTETAHNAIRCQVLF